MSYNIDFTLAGSNRIEAALCQRLEQIRLSQNITQAQLAEEAGVSLRTIGRMEKGEGISLDTFIRVLLALGIQQNLEILLPDPAVFPLEIIKSGKVIRQRSRSKKPGKESKSWSWGDEKDD